ncbi:MAG: hypothetical protein JRJ21_11385, partial [Deltaproteobacteria bacterium]|nr:hypothetical protein [Deltaproteobacteria bacterium]
MIIKERLHDSDFVNNCSFGFHDWSSADGKDHMGFKAMVLNNYSPGKVAKITGLKNADIVSLAR